MVAQSASPSHTRIWTSSGRASTLRVLAIDFLAASATTIGASSSSMVVGAIGVFLTGLLRALFLSGLYAVRLSHVHFSLWNFEMTESDMIVMAIASRALPGGLFFLLFFPAVSRVADGRVVFFMRTMLDHWGMCFFIVTMKL
jgi:hypothetical protein